MQHCKKCNIKIRGNKSCCPLCHGKIYGEPENPCFKVIPEKSLSSFTFVKISKFILFTVLVIMGAIQLLNGFDLTWPWIVTVAAILAYIDAYLSFYLRSNLMNLISAQGWILVIAIYIIDRKYVHYMGFSVTWVIPVIFMIVPLAVSIMGKVNKQHTVDYVMYMLGNTLLSLVQTVPVLNGHNKHPLLAVISISVGLIYMCYVFVFRWKDIKNAFAKYMHL